MGELTLQKTRKAKEKTITSGGNSIHNRSCLEENYTRGQDGKSCEKRARSTRPGSLRKKILNKKKEGVQKTKKKNLDFSKMEKREQRKKARSKSGNVIIIRVGMT